MVNRKWFKKAGPCATGACEPRQVRKEATVSKYFWVPQVAWPFLLLSVLEINSYGLPGLGAQMAPSNV